MAEDNNNKPQKVEKKLAIPYSIRSMSRREKVLRLLLVLLVSIVLVGVILYFSLQIINLFPEYILISTENDLLKIMIEADGILLGFVGIIFAQLFSSILDQQNVLYQSILDKGDETGDKKKSIDFLDYRRNSLAFTIAFTFLFLLLSIFGSMVNIAKNSQNLPTDTFSSSILFVPLFFMVVGVVLLMVAFIALPIRPPLEKIRNE
jgi:ABC-type sugar transport system permease subunit